MDEAPASTQVNQRTRVFELILVFGSVFGSSLLLSFYTVITSAQLIPRGFSPALEIAHGMISELFGIALLVYVLMRRGETVADLGTAFRGRDGWSVAGLILGGGIAAWLVTVLLWFGGYAVTGHTLTTEPRNVEFLQESSKGWMLCLSLPFVLINPFAEELIARAFVIREVRFLTGSSATAVCVSVGLQSAYHLYQGIVPALSYAAMFTVFSIYYVRSGRIVPIILAHLFFDVTALFASGFQHSSH